MKKPETVKVTFLVPRESPEETTIAVVEAIVAKKEVNSLVVTKNFFQALRRAITNWIKNTKEGKVEWKASGFDFNICDLSILLPPSRSLKTSLKWEGIHSISIDIHSSDQACWFFDDVIVSESELKT